MSHEHGRMNYREIAKTGVKVSEVSFGCWTMGGINFTPTGQSVGWARPDENEISEAICAGLDAGVNHFDNADIYGNGKAERMLTRVLKKLGRKSETLIIATKVGHFAGTAEHAYHPFHIKRQFEQSLINLGRDYIDIYYFHHGDFGKDDRYLDGAVKVMDELHSEGKIRVKGLSAYSSADFTRLVPVIKPHVLQSWAHALDDQFIREDSEVDHLLKVQGLSFVAFSPLAQGILLDKYDPDKPVKFEAGDNRQNGYWFQPDNLRKLKPKLSTLKERFGSTPEQLARMSLQYVLHNPRVACVIPGFRNLHQAQCNISASHPPLTDDDIRFISDTLKK
ncbi:MAG: aldo/keto reductase [Verrucomicrobiota bacterium]|nr:aldo/keto reductase [Verrucomicrobiota bacterium]